MKSYLKLFLIIFWMGIIFYFSHQNGSESSKSSGTVVLILTNMGININSFLGNMTQLTIRKSAHMFEYFVLFNLLYSYLKDFIKYKNSLYLSVLFSFLYACTDEIHQTFVPMRSGSIIDVFVDTFGALIGMLIIIMFKKYKKTLI